MISVVGSFTSKEVVLLEIKLLKVLLFLIVCVISIIVESRSIVHDETFDELLDDPFLFKISFELDE